MAYENGVLINHYAAMRRHKNKMKNGKYGNMREYWKADSYSQSARSKNYEHSKERIEHNKQCHAALEYIDIDEKEPETKFDFIIEF